MFITGDGFIDFYEYKKMMKDQYVTIDMEQERLFAAFKVLDRDNDGYLSKKELKYALSFRENVLSDIEIDDILGDADKNGDGLIDYKGINSTRLPN